MVEREEASGRLRLSHEQIEKMRAELEAEVGPDVAKQVSDILTMQRFFRATGGDTAKTLARLIENAEWRAGMRPECMECSACASDSRSHYLHL